MVYAMKALVYEEPWKMTLQDLPKPEPAPGEVVIKMESVGICGSDVHGFTGESGRRAPGMVMGHEVVGRVVERANDVSDLAIDQRVTVFNVLSDEAPSPEEGDPSFLNKRVVGVNLRGLFLSTKFALPHLCESKAGRIVNIASVHAFGGGGGPAYAPAKAGVVNLTRDTAVEVGRKGVTANAICPGYIETPIQDYLTQEQIAFSREHTPLPRMGKPRDIGRACVFLASDDAEWITGVALPVDGGWLAPL